MTRLDRIGALERQLAELRAGAVQLRVDDESIDRRIRTLSGLGASLQQMYSQKQAKRTQGGLNGGAT